MNITVTKNPNPGKLPPADQLGFGSVFTDQCMNCGRTYLHIDLIQCNYTRKLFAYVF